MRWIIAFLWLSVSLPAFAAEVSAVPQIVDADTAYAGSTKIRKVLMPPKWTRFASMLPICIYHICRAGSFTIG
jgi:hypothetical protein